MVLFLTFDEHDAKEGWRVAYASVSLELLWSDLGVPVKDQSSQQVPPRVAAAAMAARLSGREERFGPGHGYRALPAGRNAVLISATAPDDQGANMPLDKLSLQLLDAAPDAMVIADHQGVILFSNAQTERLFGYERHTLTGLPVEVLIPERFGASHQAHRKTYATNPHPRMMGQGLELLGRRKDGSEFPVEISLSPLDVPGGLLVSAAVRDITERKRAEAELRQSEERLRLIVDTAYNGFIAMDEHGRITEWNLKAETMLGWPRAEALGRDLADTIIPEIQREAHRRGLGRYLATGDGPVLGRRLEMQAVRRDGTELPVELTITPAMHGGRRIFNAFLADLTERKRAEALFKDLLESAPDAMVIVDDKGSIVLVNAQTERLFGHKRSDLIGGPVETLIPERYRKAHKGHRKGFFQNPHTRMMGAGLELHGLHRDGHEFPVEISLSPLQTMDGGLVSAAIRDITARKEAEAKVVELNRTLEIRVAQRTDELMRSEQRFHEALDKMMEGVQVIDREWRYTYLNDALVGQSMLTREQLLGHTMMECYPGIEHTVMFRTLQQCWADGTPRMFENEFTFPDGSTGFYELSVQPMRDSLFILSTDITERKRAEEAVLRQHEQLELQNHELEQFAYIASHDLQEPLRMVASFLQLLEQRYKDQLGTEGAEFITYAVDGAKRMKRLIDDLLLYSRLGKPAEVSAVELDSVLAQVLKDLGPSIQEHGATVESDALPRVVMARTEAEQMFQNLLSNAIKFRQEDVPPRIRITCRQDEECWHFEVHDNGIGIDEEYKDKVFMPFKRLHDRAKYPGSGIGLAIAHKIVVRYNGRIWFTSVPGRGTVFHFTLKR